MYAILICLANKAYCGNKAAKGTHFFGNILNFGAIIIEKNG